jgi:bifunctional non-homologous end joining protein LigD
MNIQTYIAQHREKSKSPKAAIVQRWESRVVPRQLHTQGKRGAQAYLEAYGRGISATKVVELALAAEHFGATSMAAGFWEAAFTLETGLRETADVSGGTSMPPVGAPATRTCEQIEICGLPEGLQPGRVVTMQPIDAPKPQSHYLLDPGFWGQPKRDGVRNVVFVGAGAIAHQSRSHSILPNLPPEFEDALSEVSRQSGAFILDTERTYLDVEGREHRTAAQAATANIELGSPSAIPVARCCIFGALYAFGQSLIDKPASERIAAAERIGSNLAGLVSRTFFEVVPTYRTTSEKISLVSLQTAEAREGEIWFRHDSPYRGGKTHDVSYRTKYLTEVTVIATGLTETTAPNRLFGALTVVSADEHRKPLGKVGSGFDAATSKAIADRVSVEAEGVKIVVLTQGFTENGQLWHPRFLQFAA